MAETINIGQIAEKIADELFVPFGWSKTGPTNTNFPCEMVAAHQKTSSPTHPTDLVLYYDNPYSAYREYFLFDLKSYANSSIKKAEMAGALRDLSKSVECANTSAKWQERFVDENIPYRIHGQLFVYNHDGEFDKSFERLFADMTPTELKHIPKSSRLFTFGPHQISYYLNVLNDVERLKGVTIPNFKRIPFLYPDRIEHVAKNPILELATVELLFGPWLMIPYQTKEGAECILFYYDGPGQEVQEFEFIFEFCFRNQIARDYSEIQIRMANAVGDAIHRFSSAKERFVKNYFPDDRFKDRMDAFRFTPIRKIVTRYLEDKIGMERRSNG